MMQQVDPRSKEKKDRAKQAVSLAMEQSWEEAASVNRGILALFPDDVEAFNRLGKALSELGRYSEARQAFQRAVELCPSNSIARKNLSRIGLLREDSPPAPSRKGVPPHFFIAETGKTGVTCLVDQAPKEVLAKMAAGEPVYLEPREHKLLVKNSLGEELGTVEPKLGLRLLRLIRGGNRYEAATTSLNDRGIQVIIKEIYQHPSQMGRLSFLPRRHDDSRPNVWEGAFPGSADEDEEPAGDQADDWGYEAEAGLNDLALPKRPSSRARRQPSAEEDEDV